MPNIVVTGRAWLDEILFRAIFDEDFHGMNSKVVSRAVHRMEAVEENAAVHGMEGARRISMEWRMALLSRGSLVSE